VIYRIPLTKSGPREKVFYPFLSYACVVEDSEDRIFVLKKDRDTT